MNYRTLLTILVGAFSGIIGGAFGIGGAFIILPAILMLGIIPDYKIAVGTVLMAMLPPISLFAFMEYYKNVRKWYIFMNLSLFCEFRLKVKFCN